MKKISLNKSVYKYIIIFIVIVLISGFIYQKKSTSLAADKNAKNLEMISDPNSKVPEFSIDQLTEFDGSDPEKPIYIGMDGLVYDVSEGRKFYEPEGSYHFLAGKDSSKDLKIAGGDIIKRKYPVVGKLVY